MKKLFTNFLGLALSVMVLASCSQMATYEQADVTPEEVASAKNGFNLTPFGAGGNENARAFVSNLNCETEACLTLGVAETFSKNVSTGTITTGQNAKVVNAVVSLIIGVDNMAYYRINYSSQRTAGNSNPDVFLYGTLNGESFGSSTVRAGKWNTLNPVSGTFQTTLFDYTTIECGDQFSYTLTEVSNGANGVISGTESLLAYCSTCDGESFDYSSSVENGLVDVTFEYSYSEEAEVSIDFTFPQIINDIPTNGSYTGADGKIYRVTGNGTVFHWTGNVSCSSESPTTFTFEGLVPDCGAGNANDGQANIWTGAKVVAIDGVALVDDILTLNVDEGPYSLKGSLSSIVYAGCTVKVKL